MYSLNRGGAFVILVLLSSFILAYPVVANASPTIVQQVSVDNAGTTVTLPFPSAVSSGDVVVVAFDVTTAVTNVATGVTDTLSSSYTAASGSPSCWAQSDGCAYIYYTTLASGGSDSVTVHFSGFQGVDIFMYEVSGITTAGATAGTGASSGGSTASVTTSSTAFTSEGFLIQTTQTLDIDSFTPGAGFTAAPEPSGDVFGLTEYSISGVSSPTNFPMTLNHSDKWDTIAVAFNLAGPAPSTVSRCPSTFGGTVMPAGANFTDGYGNTWMVPSGTGSGGTYGSFFFAGPQTTIPAPMYSGWAGVYGNYSDQLGWIITVYCN